jgi:hypothetical protein
VPRRLRYTDKALADLDAIRGWLTQPGAGPAAGRKLMAVRTSIRRLRPAPLPLPDWTISGCARPGSNTTAGDVQVLRVFGPGQD